ncbi:MAG: hypothetical protein ACYCV5_07290 [Acidimicrobiales bacterium]
MGAASTAYLTGTAPPGHHPGMHPVLTLCRLLAGDRPPRPTGRHRPSGARTTRRVSRTTRRVFGDDASLREIAA